MPRRKTPLNPGNKDDQTKQPPIPLPSRESGMPFHRGMVQLGGGIGGFLFTLMTYSEKLKSPRWQKKRLEILKRDNFTCQSCGDEESTLHVHHSYYEKGKPPWDYPSESLSTQCEKCHAEIEGFLLSIRRYVADNTSLCKRAEQFAAALACDEKRFKRLTHAVSAFSDLLMDYDLFGADDATFRNTIGIMVSSLVQQRNDDEARLEKIMNSHENQNNQA